MGFKHAAVLSSVSFFLGVLFICFNVDHRILWGKQKDEAIRDGFQFYTTFFNAPPAIKALLHGLVGIGLIGLIAKLHAWDDSAMFFDGSSIVAYVFSIAIYLTSIIPALRTIVTQAADVDARQDRIDAMQLLSASNVIIMACLGAILCLQAGQEYAKRLDAKERAIALEQEKDAVGSEKKDQ